MPDDGLDGGTPAHLAFDLGRHAPLLTGDEDPELVIGRRIVAAIALVGEGPLYGVADESGITVASV
jgi:hypothetical protein